MIEDSFESKLRENYFGIFELNYNWNFYELSSKVVDYYNAYMLTESIALGTLAPA